MKEDILEAVREAVRSEVIDSMISFHQHAISVLRYDITLAQKQSTADIFMCRNIKAKKADRPETASSSNAPVQAPHQVTLDRLSASTTHLTWGQDLSNIRRRRPRVQSQPIPISIPPPRTAGTAVTLRPITAIG